MVHKVRVFKQFGVMQQTVHPVKISMVDDEVDDQTHRDPPG